MSENNKSNDDDDDDDDDNVDDDDDDNNNNNNNNNNKHVTKSVETSKGGKVIILWNQQVQTRYSISSIPPLPHPS